MTSTRNNWEPCSGAGLWIHSPDTLGLSQDEGLGLGSLLLKDKKRCWQNSSGSSLSRKVCMKTLNPSKSISWKVHRQKTANIILLTKQSCTWNRRKSKVESNLSIVLLLEFEYLINNTWVSSQLTFYFAVDSNNKIKTELWTRRASQLIVNVGTTVTWLRISCFCVRQQRTEKDSSDRLNIWFACNKWKLLENSVDDRRTNLLWVVLGQQPIPVELLEDIFELLGGVCGSHDHTLLVISVLHISVNQWIQLSGTGKTIIESKRCS